MKIALAITRTVVMAMSVMSVPNTLRGLEENVEDKAINTSGAPPLDRGKYEKDKDFLFKPEEDGTSKTDEHHRALAVPKSQRAGGESFDGYDYDDFPSNFVRNPGLSGFHFDYETDRPLTVARIMVKPDKNGADVAFRDSSDNDIGWEVQATELPTGTTYHSTSGSPLTRCYTSSDLEEAEGYVPVIQGFDLEFDWTETEDMPLEQVQVHLFKNGPNVRLTACLHAGDDDDPFMYTVHYALVPEKKVMHNGYSTGLQSSDGGYDYQHCNHKSQNYGMVLSGFNLHFKDHSHSIDEVGILSDDNTWCDAYFHDGTDSNPFEWNVWYHLVKN